MCIPSQHTTLSCSWKGSLSQIRLQANVLLDPKRYDPCDEFFWKGFVQGKLYGSLGGLVLCEIVFESLNTTGCRIKTDMVFCRGEVDQIFSQEEGRHPIAHLLDRLRCCLGNGLSHLVQQVLHVGREGRDICIYRGNLVCRFHTWPPYYDLKDTIGIWFCQCRKYSASVRVTHFHVEDTDHNQSLERADRALYTAKRSGKIGSKYNYNGTGLPRYRCMDIDTFYLTVKTTCEAQLSPSESVIVTTKGISVPPGVSESMTKRNVLASPLIVDCVLVA